MAKLHHRVLWQYAFVSPFPYRFHSNVEPFSQLFCCEKLFILQVVKERAYLSIGKSQMGSGFFRYLLVGNEVRT